MPSDGATPVGEIVDFVDTWQDRVTEAEIVSSIDKWNDEPTGEIPARVVEQLRTEMADPNPTLRMSEEVLTRLRLACRR